MANGMMAVRRTAVVLAEGVGAGRQQQQRLALVAPPNGLMQRRGPLRAHRLHIRARAQQLRARAQPQSVPEPQRHKHSTILARGQSLRPLPAHPRTPAVAAPAHMSGRD